MIEVMAQSEQMLLDCFTSDKRQRGMHHTPKVDHWRDIERFTQYTSWSFRF